ADAGRLAGRRIGDRDIRQVDRAFLADEAAFLRTRLLLMADMDVHAADNRTLVLRADGEHFARLALVTAGENDDAVALLDLRSHHNTSGASEMIFMWFFARSSRGTGPKIRVPIGSPSLLTRTAALRSKRITEPSGRLMSFAVRTITALRTSPFFTRPRGIASLTETTIVSPTEAYLRF